MSPESDENKNETLLDLSFVPSWARKPPETTPFRESDDRAGGGRGPGRRYDERRDGRDRDRVDRGARPSRDRDARRGDAGRGGPRRDRVGPDGMPPPPLTAGLEPGAQDRPGQDHERGGAGRPWRGEALPPPLPLEVTFVPERAGLQTVARRVAKVSRAFSLFDVAALFLNQAEHYTVRIVVTPPPRPAPGPAPDAPPPAAAGTVQPADESPATAAEPPAAAPETRPPATPAETPEKGITLVQCRECKQVFLERAQAVAHVLGKHFDKFYRREERDVEPPQGNFSSVGRCGLSGELLGPPNYHGYNDRVMELHRTRYSHLTLEEYRRRIENVHDAALIEQWKEGMRKKAVFVVTAEPDHEPLGGFGEAENHFIAHYAAEVLKEGTSFTLPGPVFRDLEDRRIRRTVMEAWHRENRFPLRLSITLRLAFRHLGLHTFKTAAGGNFVTAIMPSPMDTDTAIPLIREILDGLDANPGLDRAGLLEKLRPGQAPDSEAGHELSNQLRWLREKGHVIEFSDGRMAAPRSAVRKVQVAKREERKHGPTRPGGGRQEGHG